MKKKIVIILVIVLVILCIVIIHGFRRKGLYSSNIKPKNGEFEIIQKTNGGVPYKWEYSISNNNVEYINSYSQDKYKDKQLAGGPVEIHYIFKGLKQGESTITFNYVSITNNSIDKTIKYKIIVDENLKSIVTKIY